MRRGTAGGLVWFRWKPICLSQHAGCSERGSGGIAVRLGNATSRRTSLPLRGERAGVRGSVFQTLRWARSWDGCE